MTNALITIQNGTSNGLIEQYSSSSDFWANFADVLAALVVLGVIAEILELAPKLLKAGMELKWDFFARRTSKIERLLAWFKKHEHRIEVWGFVFWLVIVLSLAGELMGGRLARHFDSLTIGLLNIKAAQLDKEAQEFRLKADELEAKMQPRVITKNQHDVFINALRNGPKPSNGIWVVRSNPTQETSNLARQMRQMLDDAELRTLPYQAGPPISLSGSASPGMFVANDWQLEGTSNFWAVLGVNGSNPAAYPPIAIALFKAFKEAKINVAFMPIEIRPVDVVLVVPNKEVRWTPSFRPRSA